MTASEVLGAGVTAQAGAWSANALVDRSKGCIPARSQARPTQPALFLAPVVGVVPIHLDEANARLTEWEHNLGPVHRPFRSEAWGLDVAGRIVSVAVSCSIVSKTVTDEAGRVWRMDEVVELARQCSAPDAGWATRPMLRLWREVCAPMWKCWPVGAAVSYSDSSHEGQMYRWDGWTLWQEKCGSSGGGTWSRKRDAGEEVMGDKRLWGYRFGAVA